MTPLARLLAARIAATGPISLADYMADCLLHPEHGYYTGGQVFGAAGDFITAPEISQMFGELVGLALAQAWIDQGRPAPFCLAEPGPGRGTLMADLWRATARVPGFHAAARPLLIEASPALRQLQQQRLSGIGARWAESLAALPDQPLFLIANEFFDALPIRQFRRDGTAWREVMVGAGPNGGLALGLSAPAPLAALDARLADTPPGGVVELCPALPALVAEIAGRIAAHGGLALIVDYGDWRARGDTFQAVQAHRPCDPLAEPGRADLTAHVDFEAIARAATAAGARAGAMIPQGVWLGRLGIAERAARLDAGLSGAQQQTHRAAFRRLTDPAEMGSLFKVLALTPHDAPLPPGCDP